MPDDEVRGGAGPTGIGIDMRQPSRNRALTPHPHTPPPARPTRYHKQLMNAILYDKIDVSKAVNVELISLDAAPQGYKDFDIGAAKKYVIDPHNMTGKV